MAIQSIGAVESVFKPSAPTLTKAADTNQQKDSSFRDILKNSINSLNDSQLQADQLSQKLALGDDVDLHEVMIASQKAQVALNLAVEVRNKAVEAYQEIMRMQV
ncbi:MULTISPECIES: flagellar hook-basal body complex protein FliE [Bacillus]|jgi:flagellar hook-basal body complex protein FliE|uniref:flagellar hook-basal body complex protein FliE n=1 Tax=Bacillus TaxID=1386 RepID=UPI00065E7937|nr:flagellar hook-basal body complex protein FliE [Bacillus smithii]AKP46861.1 Flagellar hook-basal body complex protein FliE [Bacillus smithii]MED4882877.1 flagellar hook-basal body complex protein FliE [Bacillus smithii]MED4926908.1 flagellar hook-basal body complex protein FliE [Bacillus smithii]